MTKRLIKIICMITAVSLFVLCFAACGEDDSGNVYSNSASTNSTASTTSETETPDETYTAPATKADDLAEGEKPYAIIDIKDYGKITVKLDPVSAPITVENFINLANSKFYDGLTFHRIMEGFMMQGGDPNGNGSGGSDKNIKGEFSANGVNNTLSHKRGAISMARATPYDSGSSQFFIVHKDASASLDGQYACFGYVTEGIEVVDKVCTTAQPTDNNGTIPKAQQPIINSIKIEYR